ncbi:MAG: Ig-like domain-containing protein, partial [Actinobacteria bacterium]|nr:Ig-like domain-containing protein [Actinomycetota bacterium]
MSNDVNLVDIGPASWTLASIGDTVVPPVTVLNARGAALDRTAALWSAADPSIVRVAGGVIVARDSGITVVRAESPTDAGRRDSIVITVTNAPKSITLSAVRDTFSAVGQSRTYSAEVRNARGNLISGYVVNWRSSNTAAVMVSATGVVTAVGVGEAWVIARAGTVSDSALVDVANLPASFETLPGTLSMTSVGDTAIVRAVARNGIGVTIGTLPEPIVWRTPDPSILNVLSDGRVIALGVGTGRVVASVSGLADTTFVTVTNAPATVQIIPVSVALTSVGDSVTPAVDIRTARGVSLDRSTVLWTSDDPAIARVTTGGIIIARDTGETYVRATSPVYSNQRDSVLVSVSNVPA